MSNRTEILASALQDRKAELESTRAELIKHEAALATARDDLTAATGDFKKWAAADQRVRFESQEIERFQGVVAQCQGNVACAAEALAAAKREVHIADLTATHDANVAKLNTDATSFVDAALELLEQAASLDALAASDASVVRELAQAGGKADAINQFHAVLAERLRRAPETHALNAISRFGFHCHETLAHELIPLLATGTPGSGSPSRANQLCMLGDRTAQAEALAQHQAAEAARHVAQPNQAPPQPSTFVERLGSAWPRWAAEKLGS